MKTKVRTYTKWSIAQKQKVLDEYNNGELSIAELCHNHKIYPAQFYQWKKQIEANSFKYKTTSKGRPKTHHVKNPQKVRQGCLIRLQYLMEEMVTVMETMKRSYLNDRA